MPQIRVQFPVEKYAERIIVAGEKYREYARFNDETSRHIAEMEKKLFPKGARILGVALRGTSYNAKNNYTGHYITQPGIDELIELMEKYVSEWDMDYVFFTNEEVETVEYVKKALGKKVIIMPRVRYEGYHKYSDNDPNPTEEDLNPLYVKGQRYSTSLDYVTEMALLSRCTALLGAMSGGVRAALFWNGEKYEHIKIIDHGYSKEKKNVVIS